MSTKFRKVAVFLALVAALPTNHAFAQTFPGGRAAGMAGAFVAVADDASAVYWNPAGIGTGAFVSAVIDYGRWRGPTAQGQPSDSQWDTTAMAGVSATALGVAYFRVGAYGTAGVESAAQGAPSREEVRRSVQASTVGVSLVQSLTGHVIVGATPKFVRGGGTSTFDVDAGVMVSLNRFRLGVVARNLTTPTFAVAAVGDPGERYKVELSREVTVGAAWGSGWTGKSRVIVSVDSDLTSRPTPAGDRRDVAAGVETWWRDQRLGVRGGLRGSTVGDARPAVAAGISVGLTPGMLLEAHLVRGHAEARSWSIGARVFY